MLLGGLFITFQIFQWNLCIFTKPLSISADIFWNLLGVFFFPPIKSGVSLSLGNLGGGVGISSKGILVFKDSFLFQSFEIKSVVLILFNSFSILETVGYVGCQLFLFRMKTKYSNNATWRNFSQNDARPETEIIFLL